MDEVSLVVVVDGHVVDERHLDGYSTAEDIGRVVRDPVRVCERADGRGQTWVVEVVATGWGVKTVARFGCEAERRVDPRTLPLAELRPALADLLGLRP